MSEGRGLLTETEREAIAGELSDSYRYKTRSYLGRRIEKLETDIEVLTEHAPELLDDLEAAVCTGRDQAGEVHGVGDTQPLQEARGSRQTPPTVNDDRPVEDTGTEAFESLSCSVIVVTPCVLDDVSAVTAAVAVDSLFDPEARLATLVADDVLSDHFHEARSR